MAAVTALCSPRTFAALPISTRSPPGDLLSRRSSLEVSRLHSHGAVRVFCWAKSNDNKLGKIIGNKALSAMSSLLLASTVISGDVPGSALAYEFESSSDRPLMTVVDETVDRDSYITMLQNIKTEEPQPLTPEERARQFKETLERKKRDAEAKMEEEKRKLEEAKKAEAEAKAKKQAEEATLKAKKQEESLERSKAPAPGPAKPSPIPKSRGFMPLFLSQFSLLLAFAGIISAILFIPQSKIKEIEQKKDEILEKVLPVVDETVEKIKPVAQETYSKTEKLISDAKPLVDEAIERSKPIIAKAIEQAKPMLEKGQKKAVELLQQSKKNE